MTSAQQSPVRRSVVAADGSEYVVTLTAAGLLIREKGKRTEYGPIAYGALFLRGAQLAAAELVVAGRKPRPRKVSRNLLRG